MQLVAEALQARRAWDPGGARAWVEGSAQLGAVLKQRAAGPTTSELLAASCWCMLMLRGWLAPRV